jgi:hypothetical protein
MKYVCVTNVDLKTAVLCTIAPMTTGPTCPEIKGFQFQWSDESTWPVALASDGTYLRAPKYYGICDDDADVNAVGVLEVLTEEEYNTRRAAELEARRPYPSWIGYIDTMTWGAPISRPANAVINGGNVRYKWDEPTVSWIPVE